MSSVKFFDNSEAFKKALKAAERATVRKTALAIAEEAKSNTPTHSGRTKNAFGLKMKKMPSGSFKATVGVWSRKQLKKKGKKIPWQLTTILEKGTKAHIIMAGRKSTRGKISRYTGKHWLTDKTLNRRYGMQINHPGSKGYGMLENAATSKKGMSQEFAREYFKKITDKLLASKYDKINDINTLINSALADATGWRKGEEAEENV